MIYKNNLKKLREEKELKLRDIDKILNFKLDTYGQFENEKTIIPIKHLNTLSNLYNVSIDYIFNLTEQTNYIKIKKEINSILSGKRLKEFRKENKLTQKKLANILNIANTMVSEYENGNYIISTHALFEICKKYNISADYLLGKTDFPKYLK